MRCTATGLSSYSAYENSRPLLNGVNDAKAVASALRGLNFEVTLGTDVDTQSFRRLVSSFSKSLQLGDVSLFYYAGHGLTAHLDMWRKPNFWNP